MEQWRAWNDILMLEGSTIPTRKKKADNPKSN